MPVWAGFDGDAADVDRMDPSSSDSSAAYAVDGICQYIKTTIISLDIVLRMSIPFIKRIVYENIPLVVR